MVKSILQIMSTPTRVRSQEQRARDLPVTTSVERLCGRRGVRLGQFDRHVLEVCLCIRRAVDPRIGEAGGIAGL